MSENGKQMETEVVDADIEPAPEAGGIVSLQRGGIDDMLYLAENIDRMIEAQNKIRGAILKLAQSGDWVIFGEGEKAKAEIGAAGAFRINAVVGISFTNWSKSKEAGTDELGQWYRWDMECDALYRGRVIRVYGRAGSRDKFFGKSQGEWKPLHQVNEGDVKIAAHRAAQKEGIKAMLGLHHMDPTFLEKYNIRLERASGYSFKSKDQKAEELQTTTVEVAEITQKKGDGWTKYVVKDAEGVVYGTFNETHAKVAKEARDQKVLVTITYKNTSKYGNEIVSLDPVAKP